METKFPLRPIRNESELIAANTCLVRLLAIENRSQEQGDYIAVLELIIQAYGDSIKWVSGRSRVESLYLQSKLTQKAFAAKVGLSTTTLTDILSGKRPISRNTRKILASHFKIHEGLFI